jgi:DNA-binding Xre family transcriptional regulator
MYITLKSYLDQLEALERSKHEAQRRKVPSIGELAGELGIHRVTLSNIANGNIRQLDLETGGRIITALRRRGFKMDVSDMIAYRPPEDVTDQAGRVQ